MAEKIKSFGVDCWLDEKDLEGGDIIPDEIIRGIDACQEAIVLISPNSVNSQWVSFEIAGIKVNSVDKAAVSGEPLPSKITRELSHADEVFVILTHESVNSSNLMFEIGAASSLRKRITPVVVGLKPSKVPSLIRNLKYIKYPDLERYI